MGVLRKLIFSNTLDSWRLVKMTPSRQAKEAGLSGLKEMSDMTGKTVRTLQNWFNDEPKLFFVAVAGCAAIKNKK